ncbi:Organic cation/carnitine transporter 3 [Striga hermonthica]|uniref:Organic cation/carnitine transporter 3 n=1 Tax=Striga hermonthica TaxID=68872 RepID=A0A9N7R8U7_STRHE|nr:Organic cation/carnitine transporter 3 [Striga hermonthica]
MTDPNPLLYPTGSPDPNDPPPTPSKHLHTATSLDATIEHCMGDFAWAQLLQATLISLAWFFDAQQTFISVFTDAEPKWTCNNSSSSTTTTPAPPCTDLCRLPPDSWSWQLPASSSIISEWSLLCSGPIVTGLPASAFFLGCLVGGFAMAALADSSLGRKNALALSSLIMSLIGAAAAFSPNVWVYAGLRFVSGFGRSTIGTSALVLSTELVGRRWREIVGVLGFTFFTLGFLSLPAIAFALRGSSWRLLYLWTGVPSVMYSAVIYFVVRESPRWLFIRGRQEEFAETLRSISGTTNRATLTGSFFSRCEVEKGSAEADDVFSALRVLVGKGWSARRLVAVMVVAFGIGMIYYGMPLGLGNLSFDLYLSVTLNALSEFPASVVTLLLIRKLGRRGFIVGLTLLSGICSVGCVVVEWRVMQVGLELVSFFGACTAFDVVLIYTVELFPTCVRNSAVSMVRQALVLGGTLSPVLVAAGRKNGLMLSYGVFGVTIAACGLAVVLLPETRGNVLCDTMEEEEGRWGAHQVYCV